MPDTGNASPVTVSGQPLSRLSARHRDNARYQIEVPLPGPSAATHGSMHPPLTRL